MKKEKDIGLDLTKTNIKKFNEYVIVESRICEKMDEDKLKRIMSDVGLDLMNDKSGYKIDITKYGKDIE